MDESSQAAPSGIPLNLENFEERISQLEKKTRNLESAVLTLKDWLKEVDVEKSCNVYLGIVSEGLE